MTKEQRKSCCDKIVQVETKQKTDDTRIDNLETLYSPVARLTTLFIICIFLLVTFCSMTGYVWSQVDSMKDNMGKILIISEGMKKDIAHVRVDVNKIQSEVRE